MKLLTKNQIQENKSKERQLDIDQGLGFAKKVDALRETKDREEKELNLFREQSIKTLKKDIETEMSKKDALIQEVRVLEERKLKALEPLTKKEESLNERENKIKENEQRVSSLIISISSKERDLSIKQEQAHSFIHQTEIALQDVKSKQIEIHDNLKTSQETLRIAQVKKDAIDSELSEKNKEITKRETAVEMREKDLKIKETNLKKIDKILSDRDRAINDKYDTLLRSIKRLNK